MSRYARVRARINQKYGYDDIDDDIIEEPMDSESLNIIVPEPQYRERSYFKYSRPNLTPLEKRREKRAALNTLKSAVGCRDCGERDERCLDFHHVNPENKYMEVARLLADNRAYHILLREIRKCVVLCANCHRKAHYTI